MHALNALRLCALAIVWLVGCVEAREPEAQGKSAFVAGLPSSSLDYGPGSSSSVSSGGSEATASGGVGATPLDPMAGSGAGAAGIAMVTGGAGGTSAIVTGGSGGAGGMSSGGVGGASGMAASGGAGGAAGVAGAAGATTATPGMLALQFMSVGNSGEYAPRNVGAVWIETSSGTFVKTLERWAGIRAGHLTKWTAASGGWGGGFFFATGGNTADQMDAITAATLRAHRMHSPTWNMKDAMGMVVPDGKYRVMIEVTESERISSSVASVELEKGPAPVSLSPPDQGPFQGLTLSYTP